MLGEDKVYLRRLRLNQQGYTDQGVYFGVGLPLYVWDSGDQDGSVRAGDREAAKQAVRAIVPDARFWG